VHVPALESTSDQVGQAQEAFFAVFDGHNGCYVSEYLEKNMYLTYKR
jgi:serine/threonine protein phosphatase PrpC